MVFLLSKLHCAFDQCMKQNVSLQSTVGSLDLGSLHTRGALVGESKSHHPRVLTGYGVNQLSQSNGGWGRRPDWIKEQWITLTQGT